MKRYLIAGIVGLLMSTGANATSNLISATVTGVTDASGTTGTGTVWDTVQNTFYTLFLYQPVLPLSNPPINGAFHNPTVNDQTALGANTFLIRGDGFNTDSFYKLTLGFAGGTVISGVYKVGSGFVSGAPGTSSGDYTLNGFFWDRGLLNRVSHFAPTRGDTEGDNLRDYVGGFSFTAVPEPSTWAMMFGGFALLGAVIRRRARTAISFA